jgi:cytochrome P450 / NADPH-cytochrome P450 reductase
LLGDWKDTYQKIACQIYDQMQRKGATALTHRGAADVTEGNVIGDFDTWMQDSLWPSVSKAFSAAEVKATTERLTTMLHIPGSGAHADAIRAEVVEVVAMTEQEGRPKYHMEIKLPAGATYEVGDYLEVYPTNTKEDMEVLLQVMGTQRHDVSDPLISTMHSHLELHQPASNKAR